MNMNYALWSYFISSNNFFILHYRVTDLLKNVMLFSRLLTYLVSWLYFRNRNNQYNSKPVCLPRFIMQRNTDKSLVKETKTISSYFSDYDFSFWASFFFSASAKVWVARERERIITNQLEDFNKLLDKLSLNPPTYAQYNLYFKTI